MKSRRHSLLRFTAMPSPGLLFLAKPAEARALFCRGALLNGTLFRVVEITIARKWFGEFDRIVTPS